MALICAIWRGRNLVLFEGANPNMVALAGGFCRYVEDYGVYNARVREAGAQSKQGGVSKWLKPPTSVLKINVDAHVREGGEGGLGVVVRDEGGTILTTATKRVKSSDLECIKALAIRYACRLP
uniref:RNase H type-1 domain-containing protein n=1 Tax=Chenopodium quinoa TaxID=63459 RepID=A0A803MVQ0_CHEQI